MPSFLLYFLCTPPYHILPVFLLLTVPPLFFHLFFFSFFRSHTFYFCESSLPPSLPSFFFKRFLLPKNPQQSHFHKNNKKYRSPPWKFSFIPGDVFRYLGAAKAPPFFFFDIFLFVFLRATALSGRPSLFKKKDKRILFRGKNL